VPKVDQPGNDDIFGAVADRRLSMSLGGECTLLHSLDKIPIKHTQKGECVDDLCSTGEDGSFANPMAAMKKKMVSSCRLFTAQLYSWYALNAYPPPYNPTITARESHGSGGRRPNESGARRWSRLERGADFGRERRPGADFRAPSFS
jgi:hypothetical protein